MAARVQDGEKDFELINKKGGAHATSAAHTNPEPPVDTTTGNPAEYASLGHLGDMACAYAFAGVEVFPCAPRAKHPLGAAAPHGVLDATSDAAQVDQWWRRWPNANIGMRLPIGCFAIDVDPRNGGEATWGRLQAEYGTAPLTRTQRTGGGGLHLLFRAPGPVRGSVGAGVDVKGRNGYLLAQPSQHPTGGFYEWIFEGEIAPAPLWLRRLVAKPRLVPRHRALADNTSARAERILETVAGAKPGERNSITYWAACRALELGLDPSRVVDAAMQAGLAHSEAVRAVASAARGAA